MRCSERRRLWVAGFRLNLEHVPNNDDWAYGDVGLCLLYYMNTVAKRMKNLAVANEAMLETDGSTRQGGAV